MAYLVISFYKYIELSDLKELRDFIRKECQELCILGRILLGKEGINGAISGKTDDINKFKKILKNIEEFADLTFREQECKRNVYHKIVVRIRDEICVFGKDVDLKNKGQYLKPSELKKWYDNNKDFIIVDARNEHEFDVGRFKDSVKLPIHNFREFADVAPRILEDKKEKNIVLYCTGGIRCEKASAYMKEQGFKKVFHVEGGIVNYVNQFKEHWEGGIFVFDDRLVSEQNEGVTKCVHCNAVTQKMINCYNLDCDTLVNVCESCQDNFGKNCSKKCQLSVRQRKEFKKKEESIIGIVENYYHKSGVVLVKTVQPIEENMTVSFIGKTTQEFQHKVKNIQIHDENLITFSVQEKLRKNDKVIL